MTPPCSAIANDDSTQNCIFYHFDFCLVKRKTMTRSSGESHDTTIIEARPLFYHCRNDDGSTKDGGPYYTSCSFLFSCTHLLGETTLQLHQLLIVSALDNSPLVQVENLMRLLQILQMMGDADRRFGLRQLVHRCL